MNNRISRTPLGKTWHKQLKYEEIHPNELNRTYRYEEARAYVDGVIPKEQSKFVFWKKETFEEYNRKKHAYVYQKTIESMERQRDSWDRAWDAIW